MATIPGVTKIEIVAGAGLGKGGPESEAQRQEENDRLAKRSNDARGRTGVALELTHAKNVNGSHRLRPHTLAILRMRSAEEPSSSRMPCPVKAMNASSSEEDSVCSLSAAGVPWATILP